MIKNSKQISSAKETLERLKDELAEIVKKKDELSEIRFQTIVDSYESLIDELNKDIGNYQNLINDGYHCFKDIRMENLGELLISVRLALGLSQRELAGIIGIQEQQIQRYEQTDYESASLTRLLEVADALSINLIYENVEILGKQSTFILPSNINDDTVIQAEISLRSKCTLTLV